MNDPGVQCPNCQADESRVCGNEIRGVYDGVLFWWCLDCGRAWQRWSDDWPRLAVKAQPFIDAINNGTARP